MDPSVAVMSVGPGHQYVTYIGQKEVVDKEGSLFQDEVERTYVEIQVDGKNWPNLTSPKAIDLVARQITDGRLVSVEYNVAQGASIGRSLRKSTVTTITGLRVEMFIAETVFKSLVVMPTDDGGYTLFLNNIDDKTTPFLASPIDMFDSGHVELPLINAANDFAIGLIGDKDFESHDEQTLISYEWGGVKIIELSSEGARQINVNFRPDRALVVFTSFAIVTPFEGKEMPAQFIDRARQLDLPAFLFEPLPANVAKVDERVTQMATAILSLKVSEEEKNILARQLVEQLTTPAIPFYRRVEVVVPGLGIAATVALFAASMAGFLWESVEDVVVNATN